MGFVMTAEPKINILVVDDLPEKLLTMQAILDDPGYNIVNVGSGREALRRLLDQDFAVILLDVNMPDMDGLETAALIRQRKRSARTPIIFVTAYADEVRIAKGYSLGAVDYILTPVVPEVLRTKVRVFADLYQKTEQVKRQAEERIALAREQAARAAAEESIRRSSFLAEASTVLASSLDFEATLQNLLGLTVPCLADLSAVTLIDELGSFSQTDEAWIDGERRFQRRIFPGPNDLLPRLREATQRVLATGKSEFVPVIGRGNSIVQDREDLCWNGDAERIPEAAWKSTLVVPLRARGKTLGALALVTAQSDRVYGSSDLVLAEDLGNRAAMAIDNARLYRDIQEADRRKNEFLAMLAHELRNPLTPIRNAVQVIRLAGPDQPDLNWARDVIDRQVSHLVRLVDDLLDVSRITRGKIRLQMEPVDVASIVERAVETSQPLIDSRRHELIVTVPSKPIWVKGDPARLSQILSNLLNNAAKYTDEGGQVLLTVEKDSGQVVFRVRDSGVGIPPEMLAHVFDLFTQVERSLDRSEGGLGIGLTLVRSLVEMHGGSVQGFSAGPNQGSEFVVRLPVLSDASSRQMSANGHPEVSREPAKCRVLVVDDNTDVANSLAMVLQISGHEVHVTYDGHSALDAADAFNPEIILLDIGLPGMDGYEVAGRLRLRPGLENTLLVALSGYGQTEDQRRSREAGFHHHLVKPVDPERLPELFTSLRKRIAEPVGSSRSREGDL
jgi:signal transduction histidine kinase/CheY-like chemotaxis protein